MTHLLLYMASICACSALGNPEGPSLTSSALAPPPPSAQCRAAFSVRWRTHGAPSAAQTLPLTCLVLGIGKLPQFQHAQTELMAFATNLLYLQTCLSSQLCQTQPGAARSLSLTAQPTHLPAHWPLRPVTQLHPPPTVLPITLW